MSTQSADTKEFTYWILKILKIGNEDMNLNENGEDIIKIPQNILVEKTNSSLLSLSWFIYL